MTQKTKAAAPRNSARTKATQGKGTRIPPFAEVDDMRQDVAETPSRAAQARAALISIFQTLPDFCYQEALKGMQARWRNGIEAGFAKGFNDGWLELCTRTGEHRGLPAYLIAPRDCTPPTWPDDTRSDNVLDLIACVLALEASCQGLGKLGKDSLIKLQWSTLERIYAAAHAEGEAMGKRRAECMFALVALGEAEADA